MAKSTILVTGAAGFIGAHVAAALAKRGDEVIIIDNFNGYYNPQLKEDRVDALLKQYKPEVYRLDIADREKLAGVFQDHKIETICHLAAQAGVRYSLERPDLYINSNIVGTHNLLEQARRAGVKNFIFASSSSVYGGNDKIPFAETDSVDRPLSLYAATKKATELEAYTYHKLFGINAIGLRFFTVYGPWGRPDMAYFLFTKAILDNQPIKVFNQGQMKRDFTYIDDIVNGVLKAVDHCRGYEIINLGNNQPVDLEKFIAVIENNLGKKAVKEYQELQPGDMVETYADINKAKKVLGWQPTTKIEEGLEQFIMWFKEYYHVK